MAGRVGKLSKYKEGSLFITGFEPMTWVDEWKGEKGAILASQPIRAFVLALMTQKRKELLRQKIEKKVLRTKCIIKI